MTVATLPYPVRNKISQRGDGEGSLQVQLGQVVSVGEPVGRCGNSGNSTEPHLHLQVSDSTDGTRARGLPFAFRRADGGTWVPANGAIVSG